MSTATPPPLPSQLAPSHLRLAVAAPRVPLVLRHMPQHQHATCHDVHARRRVAGRQRRVARNHYQLVRGLGQRRQRRLGLGLERTLKHRKAWKQGRGEVDEHTSLTQYACD